VQIGITLPTFSPDADGVVAAARVAEKAGLHGVFVFDHLWPRGSPSRPALSLYPVMGAVLASTRSIRVGTLVARVGLLPDEVVLASLGSLARMAEGRLIAAVGTGDSSSADENTRLGIPYGSARWRRERLRHVAETLEAMGVETWIGAGGPATSEIAQATGATLNLWDADPADLRAAAATGSPVSWAGPLPADSAPADRLRAIGSAGATWAVWGWPQSIDLVVSAAAEAGVALGRRRSSLD